MPSQLSHKAELVLTALIAVAATLMLTFNYVIDTGIHYDELRWKQQFQSERVINKQAREIADLRTLVHVLSDSKPMVFTAYNALPSQTDDTPNITASNKEIFEGVLALSQEMLTPYGHGGTIAYGDTVLVMLEMIVEDTMHERWRSRGDVFMVDYADAVNFGKRTGRLYHQTADM